MLPVADVLLQIGFALAQRGIEIAVFRLIEHDVRNNAGGLNRFSTGRVIARNGDFQAGFRPKRPYRLDRTFAERLPAHDGGPLVVLQGARNDFTGRGRSFVDQHHQGNCFDLCRQGLHRIFGKHVAQVVLWLGLVYRVAVVELAFGGNHSHALWQKSC